MEILTESAKETKEFGRKIGINLIANYDLRFTDYAATIALTGELGSGKTTFVQGLAEGLGIKQRIISPTFILIRKYKLLFTNYDLRFTNFYHIDLYRLEENVEAEVRNLGVEEIWGSSENVVVIEWAEKIKSMIPKNATWTKFENMGGNRRLIVIDDLRFTIV